MSQTETKPLPLFIAINAAEDVAQAGHDTDEADSLEAAWTEAMEAIASEVGVEVEIVTGRQARSSETPCADGEPLETVLWQAAHDSIRRDEDGEWSVGTIRVTDALRRAVRAAR